MGSRWACNSHAVGNWLPRTSPGVAGCAGHSLCARSFCDVRAFFSMEVTRGKRSHCGFSQNHVALGSYRTLPGNLDTFDQPPLLSGMRVWTKLGSSRSCGEPNIFLRTVL